MPGAPGREVGPRRRVKYGNRWRRGVCSRGRSGWGLPKGTGHPNPAVTEGTSSRPRGPRPACHIVSGYGKQWSPFQSTGGSRRPGLRRR